MRTPAPLSSSYPPPKIPLQSRPPNRTIPAHQTNARLASSVTLAPYVAPVAAFAATQMRLAGTKALTARQYHGSPPRLTLKRAEFWSGRNSTTRPWILSLTQIPYHLHPDATWAPRTRPGCGDHSLHLAPPPPGRICATQTTDCGRVRRPPWPTSPLITPMCAGAPHLQDSKLVLPPTLKRAAVQHHTTKL